MTIGSGFGKAKLTPFLYYGSILTYFLFRSSVVAYPYYSFIKYLVTFDNIIAVAASGYAFYLMRTAELMVGSTNYTSVVLTLLVFLVPIKYALFRFQCGSSGCFFLVGGLLSFYWMVPASPSDSYRLVSSFFVSNKLITLFLSLLCTIRSGWCALLEVILGIAIGFIVTPSVKHPRPLIQCPAFIVSSLTSILSSMSPPPPSMRQSMQQSMRQQSAQQSAQRPTRRTQYDGNPRQGDYETEVVAEEEKVQELMAMGFERSKAERALKRTLNDMNAAANILLNE